MRLLLAIIVLVFGAAWLDIVEADRLRGWQHAVAHEALIVTGAMLGIAFYRRAAWLWRRRRAARAAVEAAELDAWGVPWSGPHVGHQTYDPSRDDD